MSSNTFIRYGFGSVRVYLYGQSGLLDFVKQTFEAEELERAETAGDGCHVEVKIGDSVVVLELGVQYVNATSSSVYVYVQDVDATYQRALQAGAISLVEPVDKPYNERNAGVKDPSGNTWWIGTYIG